MRILPGPPRGVSYASEIAEQHGISYEQLVALFRRRGLLAADAPSDGTRDAAEATATLPM